MTKKKRIVKRRKEKTLNPKIVDIGNALLDLRIKMGMTQEELRSHSGLTPKQIVEIEKGRTNFTVGSLLSYLNAVERDLIFVEK